MLFFAFKASESLPPPAYFGNDYQIKQDPNHPSMLHFTPAIMKSASNCLLSFVESHPVSPTGLDHTLTSHQSYGTRM